MDFLDVINRPSLSIKSTLKGKIEIGRTLISIYTQSLFFLVVLSALS